MLKFQFPYNRKTVDDVKEIAGRKWNADKLCWTAPLTMENLKAAIAFGRKWDLEVVPEIKEAYEELQEGSEEAKELSRAKDADLATPTVNGELYGFQKAGVIYALKKKRVLIADEMGLGKTVQALVTVELADAYPAVVVVPAAVKFNWEKEVAKWLPHRSSVVLSGRTVPWDIEIDADFVVINYDVLSPWLDTLKGLEPKTVIFDESHYLKNSRTQRTSPRRWSTGSP
jgi:SNF2 family DNA or RNA helicase